MLFIKTLIHRPIRMVKAVSTRETQCAPAHEYRSD